MSNPGTATEDADAWAVISCAENPLDVTPMQSRGFLSARIRRVVVVVAVLAGGVAELAIIWVAYELVDLSISLMEVWTQLARKHLELTLFWHW